eukprot:148516_1
MILMVSSKFSFKFVMLLLSLMIVLYLVSEYSLRYSFGVERHETPPRITIMQQEPYHESSENNKIHHTQLPRRVLFFGYCRHYHDFDARFAQYSIEQLPNSEFHTVNLDELRLNESMKQLNEYAIDTYKLQANIDKWQWTLWPTCGQYKNNLYMKHRNLIKQSKLYFNTVSNIKYPKNNGVINQWYHDVYWPDTSHTIPLSHPSRALIVAMSGEVFWEEDYGKGDNIDFELMRSRGHPKTLSFTGHWLQSAKGFYRKSYNRDDRNLALLENQYQTRRNQEWNDIYKNKTEFCVMIVKTVYKRGTYYPDALVRHATFKLLSQNYKQCHSRGQAYVIPDSITRCDSKLGDIGTFICMKPYKFAITMENTLRAGYMSEKIFNAIFADTIPIYFGLPDIDIYNINLNRFVYCNISQNKILQMRKMQSKHGKEWFFDKSNINPGDDELIDWAIQQLKHELQPCINEIIELDNNKELYMNKVKQSIFKTGTTKKSQFDGYTLGVGFGDVLKTLQSYIFQDL